MKYTKLIIAVPVQEEMDFLPGLMTSLEEQTYRNFETVVCINQPDDWWEIPGKRSICQNNQKTFDYLKDLKQSNLTIIDRFSKGNGWKGKKQGVGWARKILMDYACSRGDDNSIIVSMDADTKFNPGYLQSIVDSFNEHTDAVAAAVSYYHELEGDSEKADRAILRYEIYLRYYLLNLFRIKSPYCFTALGSAISVPVWSYKAVSGITPYLGGEDFYFLQKLRKFGKLILWTGESVYPSSRPSGRVAFGTGPAVKKGMVGDWKSSSMFPYSHFDKVKETYDLFEKLYSNEIETPMSDFLRKVFRTNELWQPIRENHTHALNFARACSQKVDALRIFQFLRSLNENDEMDNEKNLFDFIKTFYGDKNVPSFFSASPEFSFDNDSIKKLDTIRNFLAEMENVCRKLSLEDFNDNSY